MISNRMSMRVNETRWLIAAAMLLVISATARAQDTRQVSEPKIPASCTQLPAQLRATSDKLGEADENKLDTARIQDAIEDRKSVV